MATILRRAALGLPLLLAAGAGRAAPAVPPFPHWIGRTAKLRGDGGAARLLLATDGTGMMAVRLWLFCRPLPIRAWQMAEDGLTLRYSRVSAVNADRLIEGMASILPEGTLLWVEAARHTAEFEGFAEAETAGRCG